MEGLLLLQVNGALFVDFKDHVSIFNLHIDRLVHLLREFALGSFHCDDTVLILSDGDTAGDANWQFSYS